MRDFPGGPVAETLHSKCRGVGLIPGQGTRSHKPQLKDPTCCNKFPCRQKKKKKNRVYGTE